MRTPTDASAGLPTAEPPVAVLPVAVLPVAVLPVEHGEPSVDPASRLLRLMSGAWATQAIAVAAELRLADHLAAPGVSTESLARETGTHHESLLRLLRYLVSLGLIQPAGAGFTLTAAGQLLREHAAGSLRPLALLYGGPFYQSFASLIDAVRTGREVFERVFGAPHFDYFAAHPELAALFDQAMAASATRFGEITRVVDFSGVNLVVDVAGGNGEMLGRIMRAHPHLRGVLLDRAHAIEAARRTLDTERCELVVGDFTVAVPPGGDMYVLSRVLHDWDDGMCRTILERVAEAMSAHAELLVVERVMPERGADSLAIAWDVHMLCDVGGRERTEAQFRELLAQAGFELTGRHELPLDAAVLRARRTRS